MVPVLSLSFFSRKWPNRAQPRDVRVDEGDVTIRLVLPSTKVTGFLPIVDALFFLISRIYPMSYPYDFHAGNMERVYALSGDSTFARYDRKLE